jgi:uncharacterized protein
MTNRWTMNLLLLAVTLSSHHAGMAQEPADPAAWRAAVEKSAPARATAPTKDGVPRKTLLFSLATGYQHSVTPYVDQVFEILAKKSGALAVTISRDLEDLSADKLKVYDVLVLNNTCSVGPRRNLLLDVLETDQRYKALSDEQRQAKAAEFEQGLLDFVRGGKGLVVIHGAPTLLNKSPEFTKMVGGAFDYHPPGQEVTVRVVDADHPLAAAFRDQGPFVYQDEPYCFAGAYNDRDFRPLLAWDNQAVKDPQGHFADQPRYAAWIRRCGQGRVFFCSPSHFPDTYMQPALLRFVLDGTQYAAGDLACDDTPTGPSH